MVNRKAIYNELPSDFIYVDGRKNKNGMIIDSKMDYVPYLDGKNKVPWYIDDAKRVESLWERTKSMAALMICMVCLRIEQMKLVSMRS